MQPFVQHISRYLFVGRNLNVFAVLDGASIPDLRDTLHELQPESVCLYRGELEPDMAQVAPYLVQLEADTKFTERVVLDGWGKHWGIFVRSTADLRVVRRHLRSLLIVNDTESRPLIFRYYDPRVLRVFLPTCDAEQLAAFFGPIDSLLLENEGGDQMLRFRRINGLLKQEKRQFTTAEQENLERDRAERELQRQQLEPSEPGDRELTEDELQHSLVDFWTTMRGFKPPEKPRKD
jgi:hypothetical protein